MSMALAALKDREDAARRLARPLAEPERDADADRRGGAGDPLDRPRRTRSSPTAARSTTWPTPIPGPDRRREAGIDQRPLRRRLQRRLLRARRAPTRRRPERLAHAAQRRRALRRRSGRSQTLVSELTTHHSSYYIDHSQAPAPLLISNGFTDDLFPADEAIRYYNRTRTQYPRSADLAVLRRLRPPARPEQGRRDRRCSTARIEAWIDYYVKGMGAAPFQGVEAITQTCPKTAPSGGPFRADDWAQLRAGRDPLRARREPQTILPRPAPRSAQTFDPVTGRGACAHGLGRRPDRARRPTGCRPRPRAATR